MTRLKLAPAAAGARMLGLGSVQPDNVVTNDDLAQRIDTDDQWIRDRVGIQSRRIADPDAKLVDLAAAAGELAVKDAGLTPTDIDTVIVASCTMPNPIPNAAAQTAYKIGMSAPAAFDLNAACAGFCSASCASAGSGPAATVCAAPLRLAGSSPSRSIVASTSSGFPPSTALMPVGSRAQAAAIARPRTAAIATAASASSTPAMAAAASSPTEWPATGVPGGTSSLRAASSAAATTSGCVTAVSLISSAPAVVPRRCRSRPIAADHRASVASASGSSSHGVSMPGDCDPCPGARSAITQ